MSAEHAKSRNPFKQSLEIQIKRLREQCELGNWGIHSDVFERLAATAPNWPRGRDAFRSFRVRFGKGREGMIQTFEAHAEAMKRVHGPKFDRRLGARTDKRGGHIDRFRLLNGDGTHEPIIEWVVIPNLSSPLRDESIRAFSFENLCGPKSIADEGLVLSWLVPERIRAIDRKTLYPFYLAGYVMSPVREESDQSLPEYLRPRNYAPVVDHHSSDGTTLLDVDDPPFPRRGCAAPSIK
ncbi:hypothetical protein IPH19_03255 [Candidatus Uhrbacteria bacterium]|jgi:hypothetical protein|nr:MAG: hypothetical protein IPH19_03255 [Candidatus Uhrbacteria bacterium]